MELEIERRRNVVIRKLFKGQVDVEANGLSSRLNGSFVRGLHDSRSASRGHDKTPPARGNLRRPLSKQIGKLASIFVVACHVDCAFSALHVECLLRTSLGTIVASLIQLAGGRFAAVY